MPHAARPDDARVVVRMGPFAHHVDLHGLVGRVGRRAGAGDRPQQHRQGRHKDHAESSHVAPSTLAPLRTTSNREPNPGFSRLSSSHGLLSGIVRTAVLIVARRRPCSCPRAPTPLPRSASPSPRTRSATARRTRSTARCSTAPSPLGAQEVVLEGRRYPYEGSYRVIARTTTDAAGKFQFKPELDRNHRLRVTAPAQAATSKVLQAYTLPAFELSFRALRPGVVRLYQRYTVPTTVRLTSPTLFYLGPRRAKRASMRKSGRGQALQGRPLHVPGGRHAARALARGVPLRELLPAVAGHRDGRPGREVPEAAPRVLRRAGSFAHGVVRS